MKTEKTYTRDEILGVLLDAAKETMENKNRYIELNGYTHKDTLQAFDIRLAQITYLMSKF
ncbi:MAG: hypothetical protein IKF39_01870 [Oscillospiraceae bacterium]|nr:hypothetical protein [Oscillospiraceae bacterium]